MLNLCSFLGSLEYILMCGITDTDQVLNIDGQDAVGDYGEVYSGTIITSIPLPFIDTVSIYHL
jgi:hypothetical protein